MNAKIFRFAVLFVCLSVCITMFAGCSGGGRTDLASTKSYAEMKPGGNEATDGKICESAGFELYWNDALKQVIFTDKQSGRRYCSLPADIIQAAESGAEDISVNANLESPVIVYYYNPSTFTDTTSLASTDAIYGGSIYTELIENGIKVTYDFSQLEIAVPVEYTVSEECFTVTVKPQEIYDGGDNFITGIALAPFLCSAKNDAPESYLFLPDGSGTLLSTATRDRFGESGSQRVYGDDLTINRHTLYSYTKQIHMPVFGAKTGDSAIFGIVTSSAEQAYINWNVGSANIGYSSVYPFFRIRGYNSVKPPARFATVAKIDVFDDGISDAPLSVSYYTLNGENADYNGMAELYRNYLIKSGALKRAENVKTPQLALKILGGLQRKKFTFGIPHTELMSLTTVEAAREMAEFFRDEIEGEIIIELVGFGTSGLDVGEVGGGFKIDSSLGKKSDISDFSAYCKENGINLFLNFDLIGFSKSGSGFSLMTDSAKWPSGQPAYFFLPDNISRKYVGDRYMLLSRGKLEKAVDKAVEATADYGIDGIALESLSYAAYSDYGVNGSEVSSGMSKAVEELFSRAGENMEVLSSGANDYAAYSSDCIIDAPLGSSKYDVSACDIPFYEMVFHGYVPLCGESVNLSEDEGDLILRCIEAGVAPTYTLLDYYDSSAVSSEFASLYGAQYAGVRERIVSVSKELDGVISKISGARIVRHRLLSESLRITEYSNGVCTAVNFSDTAQSYNGHEIAAGGYAVWED